MKKWIQRIVLLAALISVVAIQEEFPEWRFKSLVLKDGVEIVEEVSRDGNIMVGFFDADGEPGLAVLSAQSSGRKFHGYQNLLRRGSDIWVTYVYFAGMTRFVILSKNPELAYIQISRSETAELEQIEVNNNPAMICLDFGIEESFAYSLFDKNKNRLDE